MPSNHKVVQIRRGTTSENATFTGLQGEITVDTDKNTVIVHNGQDVGGFPLRKASDTSDRLKYVTYRAASVQFNTPCLGFSCDFNGPTPISIITPQMGNMIIGAASFLQDVEQSVYDHFIVPSNFVGPLSLEILWRSFRNAGQVVWELQTSGVSQNQAFESGTVAITNIDAIPSATPNGIVLSTISNIVVPGFVPDQESELYFKFSRLVDSSVELPADLISLRFVLPLREI